MEKINLDSKIVITGATGFLGKSVVKEFTRNGYDYLIPLGSKEFDLRLVEDVQYMYSTLNPDIVVHLAATVGGIGANQKSPGRFMYDNLSMGLNLIEEGRKNNLKKFVHISTVCSYPRITPVPFNEEDLDKGTPEITNAPYGVAKKTLGMLLDSYKKEYSMNSVYLIPTNMYGPHDSCNLDTNHVIPAIIIKTLEAQAKGLPYVSCWGDGSVSRDFLFVEDCAKAIVKAVQKINTPIPINIGSGTEIKISDLVKMIIKLIGYKGDIHWDVSKPNGQPRRCLDIARAKTLLDWEPLINFESGLMATIEWYKKELSYE
jgi:GDP-L-fucose synthase